ncbi:MAG: LytR/AlgR family response regulator transcription factor [Thermoanaerobaculia bacterium]
MSIRAVIVEDEPHARASLRDYASEIDWLTLVGEAADGNEAVRLIDALAPELVFLDISLPEASGLEVLQRITHTPDVVFTTAHDQHALAAFELGALDYLLKPFGRQRFQTAVERVRRRLQSSVTAPDRARSAFGTPLRRLFARTRDGIVPIDVSAIQHISASGDYVEVHTGRESHLLHTTLAELMARLDPEVFRQVHRSHVVNLDAIAKLVPFDARRLLIRLRSGQEIVASRAASEQLRGLIG